MAETKTKAPADLQHIINRTRRWAVDASNHGDKEAAEGFWEIAGWLEAYRPTADRENRVVKALSDMLEIYAPTNAYSFQELAEWSTRELNVIRAARAALAAYGEGSNDQEADH